MGGLGLKETREWEGLRKCDERCFKAIVFFNIGRKTTVPRASRCYEPGRLLLFGCCVVSIKEKANFVCFSKGESFEREPINAGRLS